MIDFATLFEIAGTMALVVAPAILLNRLLAGSEGPSLTDILAKPVNPPWPRGVQEEEPAPWRLERLNARTTSATNGLPARVNPGRAGRPVMESGLETIQCS